MNPYDYMSIWGYESMYFTLDWYCCFHKYIHLCDLSKCLSEGKSPSVVSLFFHFFSLSETIGIKWMFMFVLLRCDITCVSSRISEVISTMSHTVQRVDFLCLNQKSEISICTQTTLIKWSELCTFILYTFIVFMHDNSELICVYFIYHQEF